MARGDLLLYRNDHSLPGDVIAFATHGPFIHVEVSLGDGSSIGALTRGIVQYIPDRVSLTRAVEVPLSGASPTNVERGIAFLQSCVGDKYGWTDIYDQAVLFLKLPRLLPFVPGTYDCSDLVTRYLTIAGGVVLGKLAQNPRLVSPNDLARLFGLIK